MPTVRLIATNALQEIGVLGEDEAMSASQGAFVLARFQHQIDAWAADRLTLALQQRTAFTLTSGTSTVTLGPTGADVTMQRPVWVDAVTYVIPGSSPDIESLPLGRMIAQQYDALTIKELASALPTQWFYQTSTTQTYGSLFLYPQVTQDVEVVVYAPLAVGVPATLDTIMIGPPGYQEAFLYQLAVRLMSPFGKRAEDLPLLVGPEGFAATAFARIKRVNVQPGLLAVDAALTPRGLGGGYNVLSDQGA
jgi:hypothetical protein